MIFCFVDNGRIDDHHCVYFHFIMNKGCLSNPSYNLVTNSTDSDTLQCYFFNINIKPNKTACNKTYKEATNLRSWFVSLKILYHQFHWSFKKEPRLWICWKSVEFRICLIFFFFFSDNWVTSFSKFNWDKKKIVSFAKKTAVGYIWKISHLVLNNNHCSVLLTKDKFYTLWYQYFIFWIHSIKIGLIHWLIDVKSVKLFQTYSRQKQVYKHQNSSLIFIVVHVKIHIFMF